MLLASSHDRPTDEDDAVEMLLSNQVNALIVGSAAGRPDAGRENRFASRTPVVYVNCDIPFTAADVQAASAMPVATALATVLRTQNSGAPYVAFDDVEATTLVADHLIGLGHERIAFVGSAPVRSSLLRLLALRSALDANGRGLTTIAECAGSLRAGYDAANELLAGSDRPTAVVAYDDLVAIGVVRAAHSLGLRVPEDVSVVGFDDIEIAGPASRRSGWGAWPSSSRSSFFVRRKHREPPTAGYARRPKLDRTAVRRRDDRTKQLAVEAKFEHVNKRFGDVEALRDLNLVVADRSFLVMLGPSGCGKTTALRVLAGLEHPSGGAIFIGNRNVTRVSARDRDIAMVFQSCACIHRCRFATTSPIHSGSGRQGRASATGSRRTSQSGSGSTSFSSAGHGNCPEANDSGSPSPAR